MNETFDPLETELSVLVPHKPSPELKERIAERLAPAMVVRPLWRWDAQRTTAALSLAAVGLVAASLAAAIVLLRGNDRPINSEAVGETMPSLLTSASLTSASLTSAFDDTLPTLWQYRCALRRSPKEFDALTDKHAGNASDAPTQVAPIRGFGLVDTSHNNLPGEL